MYRIFVLFLILCFFNSSVVAGDVVQAFIAELKKYEARENLFIKFKLLNGDKITVRYNSRTDIYLSGNKAKFDRERFIVTDLKEKVYYKNIKSYEIITKYLDLTGMEFKNVFIQKLKKLNLKKSNWILIKLKNDTKVRINLIEFTDDFISGYLIKIDRGNPVTTDTILKINYEEIDSYKFANPVHDFFLGFGLAVGTLLFLATLFIIAMSQADWSGLN